MRGAVRPWGLLLLLYLGLAAAYLLPGWTDPLHRYVGVGADPLQQLWAFRWWAHAVTTGVDPWNTTLLDHPRGIDVAWNTTAPLASVLLTPITLWAGPSVSYALAMTLGIGLSAFTAHIAIRRFSGSHAASVPGALVFGFSPYVQAHALGHLHLVLPFLVPPILLLVYDAAVTRRHSALACGVLLGLACTAQLLLSEELLAIVSVGAAALLAVLALVHREAVRSAIPHLLRTVAIALGVFVPLAAWPLWAQLHGLNAVRGVVHNTEGFGSDLLNVVAPTTQQLIDPTPLRRLSGHFLGGNVAEAGSYVGIPLLVLLAVLLVRRRKDPLVLAVSLTTLVVGCLSLGSSLYARGHAFHLPLPWRLFSWIPLLGNLLPVRLMVLVYLGVGLLLALALGRIVGKVPGRNGTFAAVAAAVVCLVPLLPAGLPSHALPVSAFHSSGGGGRAIPEGSVVLAIPYPSGDDYAPIYWQAEDGFRYSLIGGYYVGADQEVTATPLTKSVLDSVENSGTPPQGGSALAAELAAEWRAAGVECVVLIGSTHPDAQTALVESVLGTSPRAVDDALVWSVRSPEGETRDC